MNGLRDVAPHNIMNKSRQKIPRFDVLVAQNSNKVRQCEGGSFGGGFEQVTAHLIFGAVQECVAFVFHHEACLAVSVWSRHWRTFPSPGFDTEAVAAGEELNERAPMQPIWDK